MEHIVPVTTHLAQPMGPWSTEAAVSLASWPGAPGWPFPQQFPADLVPGSYRFTFLPGLFLPKVADSPPQVSIPFPQGPYRFS